MWQKGKVSPINYKGPMCAAKKKDSPNPGVCFLWCSQVLGSLQCRDIVAPELNRT